MTADCVEDFDYEPMNQSGDRAARQAYWSIARGLQKVDDLQTSEYLDDVAQKHIDGAYSTSEVGEVLKAYYEQVHASEPSNIESSVARQQEADMVSFRIVELLGKRAFFLAPQSLAAIHQHLFQDLDTNVYHPGVYKTQALVKREFILNGDSVLYADPSLVRKSLDYLFDKEGEYAYDSSFDDEQLKHFAQFVSHVWQVHPFIKGNTHTVAVFCVLYLDSLGFDVSNDPFARHARYFRDALVRANYRNAKAGIMPTLDFLVRFFQNLLVGQSFELRSRDLVCQPLFDDPTLLRNMSPREALR